MTQEQLNTLLGCNIVPATISIIVEKEGLSEEQAVYLFYDSKTYRLLEIEDTKVWHFSPYCLYTIWKSEQETGEPDWPEVGLLA